MEADGLCDGRADRIAEQDHGTVRRPGRRFRWQLIRTTISVGIWQGMGIVFGHELWHTGLDVSFVALDHGALGRRRAFPSLMSMIAMSIWATPPTPPPAPRGRSLYEQRPVPFQTTTSSPAPSASGSRAPEKPSVCRCATRWIRGCLMSLPSVALFTVRQQNRVASPCWPASGPSPTSNWKCSTTSTLWSGPRGR